jgi:sigma-B regulation protein RsbU (phosphoserine phosphatase)
MSSRRDSPAGRASRLPAPPPLFRPVLANAPEPGVVALRRLLFERWPGRTLFAGLALRLLVWLAEWLVGENLVSRLLGISGSLGILVGGVVVLVWVFQRARTRLLWRVRERLVVSYLFIGVVPALLIAAFFMFGMALLVVYVSAYLFKTGVTGVVADTQYIATAVADELDRGGEGVQAVLDRQVKRAVLRYPGLSLVVVPRQADVRARPAVAAATTGRETSLVRAGAWTHLPALDRLPAWAAQAGFADVVTYGGSAEEPIELVARAVAHGRSREWSVIVDVPLDEAVWAAVEAQTGIEMIDLASGATAGAAPRSTAASMAAAASRRTLIHYIQTGSGGKWVVQPFVMIPVQDWASHAGGDVTAQIRVAPGEMYRRVSGAQGRVQGGNMAEVMVLVLGFIGVLFLVIEGAALAMGWALARSITGSVHALFTGTERLRLGDLGHRIPIRSRDQLGELAESFNAMTANIETLLEQAAEKRRLEEELRIARDIQMSLLPRHATLVPGLSLAALCVPAREVGGDYYDIFPLGPRRVGLLVADVAGKGTSAALYMAELKGLMLSLSQIHASPRALLVEVNRIIAHNLDSRSFITMTYAIIDLDRGTLIYARAGHTPIVHHAAATGQAQLAAPSGMVVGLQLDGLEHKFAELLEEATVPLVDGDIFLLYTDGVSEAMNADGDLYGEERLRALVEAHAGLGADGLRERLVRDIEAHVGGADAHDDMTLIVVSVDKVGPA